MWIKALDVAPKEGVMLATTIKGVKIFVTMNNNTLYAAENRCPHEDIELTLGCLKGNRIYCALHGYSFDLLTGNSSEETVYNMKTYAVKQKNNGIYVKL